MENEIKRYYDAVVEMMDDEIREAVHVDLAPCTEREFLAEYCARHMAAFGAEFLDAANRPAFDEFERIRLTPHYYIVDDATTRNGLVDFIETDDVDDDEAILSLRLAWDRLSDYDKARRDAFYLISAPLDEDGCVDENNARFIASIK